jgi:hypothetical protein
MSWQTAFTLLQVGTSILEGKGERDLDRARQKADQSAVNARAGVRRASNFRAAAQADLARFTQGLNNRRMRKQATTREATARAAVLAQRDARSARSFEGRIAASERAGALAAMSAAAGVSGGTYDVLAGAQALQQARQEFSARRAGRAQDYGLEIDSAEAADSAVAGLDNRTVFATIDRSVENPAQRRVGGSVFDDIIKSGVTPQGLVAAAEDIQRSAEPYVRSLLGKIDNRYSTNFSGFAGGGPVPFIPTTEGDGR